MTVRASPLNIFNRSAPLVALAVIGGIMFTRPGVVRAVPGAERYFDSIRLAAEAIPYKIGPWLGEDMTVAPAAVKLLQPNSIIQRQYADPSTGRTLHMLFVHCGNTLDMQGHYPPVCYPAHGWREVDRKPVSVPAASASLPATRYTFSRVMDGLERRMSVINLIVVPRNDEQFFADMTALNRASQSVRTAGLGAAQVQIVSMNDQVDLERDPAVAQFMQAIDPVLRVIAEGVTGDES